MILILSGTTFDRKVDKFYSTNVKIDRFYLDMIYVRILVHSQSMNTNIAQIYGNQIYFWIIFFAVFTPKYIMGMKCNVKNGIVWRWLATANNRKCKEFPIFRHNISRVTTLGYFIVPKNVSINQMVNDDDRCRSLA